MSTEVIASTSAAPAVAPEGTPFTLLRDAVAKGLDAGQLKSLTEFYERWLADTKAEAKRAAYQAALLAFRAKVRPIRKDQGGTEDVGFKYASLYNIDTTITPILSEFCLTATWKIVDQARDWVRVRCTLTHVDGHFDVCDLGGPPDRTGGKNEPQAISSTVSMLERYTLIAVCGLTTREQDDDGNGGEMLTPGKLVNDRLVAMLGKAANDPTALVIWQVGNAALKAMGEDKWADAFKSSAVAVRSAFAAKNGAPAHGPTGGTS